jgi:hypothetical protein
MLAWFEFFPWNISGKQLFKNGIIEMSPGTTITATAKKRNAAAS